MKLSTIHTQGANGVAARGFRCDGSSRANGWSRVWKQGGGNGRRSQRLVASLLITVMALALVLTPARRGWRASAEELSCGITEITFTTGAGIDVPSINGDGTHIAFTSNRDLTGDNADGNFEIFLYDTESGTFTQVTDTTGGSTGQTSINSDGTYFN